VCRVRSSCLRFRLGALFVVLAVAFGVLPATAFVSPQLAAAATATPVPDSASDAVTAVQYAMQGRKKVLVNDQTTETAETVANPDGTLTETSHVRPVRVRQGSGWATPDSTLVPGAGGTFAPKAAAADVALSGGRRVQPQVGAVQPLLKLTAGGTATGLDWPGALPAPVVTGSIATYADVLPGVDLKVEVEVDTVREVVVVKTPAAAKNPAIAELGLTVPVRNGTVTKDADGTLHVRDAKGAEKFSAPPAVMWDSSGVDPSGTDFVHGPAAGGREAPVGESLDGTKLTLTPDQKLFTDAQTTYPVYVDPAWHDNYCGACGRNHYLVEYGCGSGKAPGYTMWDNDDQLRAGFVNDGSAHCGGSTLVTARSFVEMNLGGLSGKLIYGAQLNLNVNNSLSCSGTNELHLSTPINAGESFNGGPSWGAYLGTVGTGCPTNVGFDVTSTIASLAGEGGPTFTFAIVSPNENDQNTWKRYSTQVGFSVTYNSPPRQPTNLQIVNGSQGYPCVQGASRPVLGRTSTGYITKANVADPDGQQLYAGFRVYKGLASSGKDTWDGKETGVDNVLSDMNTGNRNASATLPVAEMNADGFYSWDVHATDGRETAWAVPCEVEVELSAPAAPVISSQTYPAGAYGGGPGRAGDFSFSVSNSPTTVDHYVWKLDNTASPSCDGTEPGTSKPSAFNGPATAVATPPTKGPHVLSAWACNRARTPSSRVDYAFNVKDATAPVASWQFEGNGKSQANGLRHVGEGVGVFSTGKLGQAANLSGQAGDYFATSARVVDTAKSFSVSAWVNPADLSARRAVLSQDGSQTSGFALQYLESGQWAFSLSNADVASPTLASAVSSAAPMTGSWTHLTGVYDGAAHTAALYVNGQLQQTVPATSAGGVGPLVLGAAMAGGARSSLFDGAIDEATVVDHVLSAADVTKLVNQNGVPTGLSAIREYTLDATTADATGTDATLSLTAGAGYGPGYSDAGAQSATETSVGQSSGQGMSDPGPGYALTAGPVIDTAKSFTVSAWVKPADSGHYTVATQAGTNNNAFILSLSPEHWGMGMSSSDVEGDAAGLRWAASPAAPVIGVWTHVTGVYDAITASERLYINGVQVAETAIPAGSTWSANGSFSVGFAQFAGTIDQVQVWDRPLPADEVTGVANTAVLRADYQLNGDVRDTVTGASGTPSGGVSSITDGSGANVARFDNSATGQVEAPRPQNLRSDQSFTVEAWVKHTWTDADAAAQKAADPANTPGVDKSGRAAVGVNSAAYSPYLLGYRGAQASDGSWHPRWSWLLASSSATPSVPAGWFVMPDVDAQSNVWTHLTGTYDATTHTACVYATTDAYEYTPRCASNVTAWNGASDAEDLFLGRGEWQGVHSDYWYGDVRGVRVYTGVLDLQHINADAVADHP
jgi:hypothetical protein